MFKTRTKSGRRRLVATVMTLVVIALGTPDLASAGGGEAVQSTSTPDVPPLDDASSAVQIGRRKGPEVEHYSMDFGVSITEAENRLERVVQLKELLLEIIRAEDGRVAAWGIVHEPKFGGWVYLVGDDEPTAPTASVQRVNDDIFVDLGAEYTLVELEAAMSDPSNYRSLPESMRGRIAYRDIDLEANSLLVAIDKGVPPLEPRFPDRPIERVAVEYLPLRQAAEVIESILEADTQLPFTLIVDSAATTTAVHGGELIQAGSDLCTSAFAVASGSTRGMLTAGHCGSASTHWRSRTGSQTGNSYSASTQAIVWGDDGDSQWYTTSQWESDDFYVTTTSTRDATGYEVRSNMQGDYVCHFGISSGDSCGWVVSTNFDPGYGVCGWWLGCDNRWVKVVGSNLEACAGDSGGPWYSNRTAYGVNSGTDSGGISDCTASGTAYAIFTAMDDVLGSLGLTFATG